MCQWRDNSERDKGFAEGVSRDAPPSFQPARSDSEAGSAVNSGALGSLVDRDSSELQIGRRETECDKGVAMITRLRTMAREKSMGCTAGRTKKVAGFGASHPDRCNQSIVDRGKLFIPYQLGSKE